MMKGDASWQQVRRSAPRPARGGYRVIKGALTRMYGSERKSWAPSGTQAWAEGSALTPAEAVAYARRARGTRKRPATGWDSLTPTEVQVVELAARA